MLSLKAFVVHNDKVLQSIAVSSAVSMKEPYENMKLLYNVQSTRNTIVSVVETWKLLLYL